MASGDDLRAELDADEKQDEILFKAGVYEMPAPRPWVATFLRVFGSIAVGVGLLFWAVVGGLPLPELGVVPSVIMTWLVLVLVLLGLACLIGGIAAARAYRRDPYEMKPIR